MGWSVQWHLSPLSLEPPRSFRANYERATASLHPQHGISDWPNPRHGAFTLAAVISIADAVRTLLLIAYTPVYFLLRISRLLPWTVTATSRKNQEVLVWKVRSWPNTTDRLNMIGSEPDSGISAPFSARRSRSMTRRILHKDSR